MKDRTKENRDEFHRLMLGFEPRVWFRRVLYTVTPHPWCSVCCDTVFPHCRTQVWCLRLSFRFKLQASRRVLQTLVSKTQLHLYNTTCLLRGSSPLTSPAPLEAPRASSGRPHIHEALAQAHGPKRGCVQRCPWRERR